MIPKQDRQGVRKATDIEQKYKLNMDTAEIEKLATNAMRAASNAQSIASSAVGTANSAMAMASGMSAQILALAELVAQHTVSIEDIIKRLEVLEAGGGGGSVLPEGYTLLEYIESSGTQYIDTGFNPKYNSRIVMDVEAASTATKWFFGARDASGGTAPNAFCFYRSTSTAVRADYFGSSVSETISDVSARAVIERNANVVSAYGLTITNTAVTSGEVPYPLFIFTLNNIGAAHANAISMKLYSCQIYDGDVLVRDYVPCINPLGEYGLYDKVNVKFYGNAGSGAFTGAYIGA